MNTRTFTATAFAVALSTSLALAQEQPESSAFGTQTGTQSGASETRPGMTGSATTLPGSSGSQTGMQSPLQAGAQFTDDKSFVRQEIQKQRILNEIYQLAQQKAQRDEVKKVVQKAIQDHKQAGEKLKEVAKDLKIEIKEDQTWSPGAAIDPNAQLAQQLKQRLQGLSDREFDREFLASLAALHQLEINRYQAASNRATEQKVKQFTQDVLPKLQQHFQDSRQAFQEVTGTAWTPSQSSFVPAALYETQPGTSGAMPPGSSSTPGQSSTSPGTSAPDQSSATDSPSQSSPGMSEQPESNR